MFMLALEYSASVFVAAVGVLQVAATYNGLKGMSFFNGKIYGYFFGFIAIIAPLAALFTWNLRNATGIIEGPEQFFCFVLAFAVALVFTFTVSSLIMGKELSGNTPEHNGLEALKEVTFFQALRYWFGHRK